ncbi:FkbM family methyltransferase [Buttiauxella gaviniae]|uniref:FkbM family methyltransferase n=1 Tax=Buttiauxella gaviniae TaxID=82990 RepID=UPI003BB7954D
MLPRVHIVNSEQGNFLTFGHDAISNHLFNRGEWESWLYRITHEFTKGLESPIIYDLGANLGAYTIPVAHLIESQNGHVYSFEPQKTIYYQLCGNVFLNRLNNVTALNKAVGELSGIIDIPVPDYNKMDNIGAFSLDEKFRKNEGTDLVLTEKNTPVEIIKLDDMLAPQKVRFIKIDVEGFELKVLKGAMNFLEHNNFPPFSFEAWNQEWFAGEKRELMDFIIKIGYEIQHIHLHDYIAQHPKSDMKVDFIKTNNVISEVKRVR